MYLNLGGSFCSGLQSPCSYITREYNILACQHNSHTFSGFSVGFYINEEEGYLLPMGINLPTLQLNAPTVIREGGAILTDFNHQWCVFAHFLNFALMTTGGFSRKVSKLFCKLKLVTGNFFLHV